MGWKFQKSKSGFGISNLEILCVPIFRQNRQLWHFGLKFAQKWILGSKFQKTKSGFEISILEIPCAPIFRQNLQLWIFRPKIAQNWILGSEFQKSLSGFGINIFNIPWVPIFSQNGQLLIFWSKFGGNCPITWIILVQIFLRVLQRAGWRLKWTGWRWMELGGGWNKLGGDGWSWVEVGARFSNTQIDFQNSLRKKKKLRGATYWLLEIKIRHCTQTTSVDTILWLFRVITNNSTNPIFYYGNVIILLTTLEAAFLRCSEEKMSWKYSANLQENTHAEVRNHFSVSVFCKFTAHFEGYFRTNFFKNPFGGLLLQRIDMFVSLVYLHVLRLKTSKLEIHNGNMHNI